MREHVASVSLEFSLFAALFPGDGIHQENLDPWIHGSAGGPCSLLFNIVLLFTLLHRENHGPTTSY